MRQTTLVTGSGQADTASRAVFLLELRNMHDSTIRPPRRPLGPIVRALQGFLVDAEALGYLAADALHLGPHLKVSLEFVVAVNLGKPGRDG
jgi:hypothetical protein